MIDPLLKYIVTKQLLSKKYPIKETMTMKQDQLKFHFRMHSPISHNCCKIPLVLIGSRCCLQFRKFVLDIKSCCFN